MIHFYFLMRKITGYPSKIRYNRFIKKF